VLVKLGADLNRVRQQVIQLLHGHRADEPTSARSAERELMVLDTRKTRLEAIEARLDTIDVLLTVVEQRVGIRADTTDLDEQIDRVRGERQAAADAQEYERAASLRDREQELLAARAGRQEQWAAEHPALPVLAERCQQLADEVERLRALLRQHGIDPRDKPA
jgi:DNA repair exonuclease SbcCD ATPase subunit